MSSTWVFISFCFLAFAMLLTFRTSTTTVTKADQSSSLARSTMLLLMVKNEELVIERMLSSAKHGARFLFVCDTGSTDGTLAIVERVWRKNYRIYSTNFTNFETTRNECNGQARVYLKEMRSLGVKLDYILLADADFVYVERSAPPPPKGGGKSTFDINIIQIHAGISGHPHNSLNMFIKYDTFIHCRYRLWTHEYLDCSAAGNVSIGHYTRFYYIDYADGKSRPEKLTRDIRLLEGWLRYVNETDLRPRALYYLARAYEDDGQLKAAMQTYERHNAVQVFTNYLFYAKYRMALITMQNTFQDVMNVNLTDPRYDGVLASADVKVEAAFWQAITEHDGFFRQEPLYWLARYFRQRGYLNKCIVYASAGLHLPSIDHDRMPLFLETHVQEWALREELAYCLKLKGRKEESVEHYKHILASEKLDKETLERIKKEIGNL